MLADEIEVSDNTATVKGSYGKLAAAITHINKGTSEEVPSFIGNWPARTDSNGLPLGSKLIYKL